MHGSGTLDKEAQAAPVWKKPGYAEEVGAGLTPDQEYMGQSFSGHERNRFFYSQGAKKFADLSGLSGLDSTADSRVLALWDPDRDGWQDLAVVSANAPLLSLYRNRIGEAPKAREQGHMIALRFEGGSRSSKANPTFGNRDGYGAIVKFSLGDRQVVRELRCGEGMAAQNSKTMLIGIGKHKTVPSLTVKWPSGLEQSFHNVTEGTLLSVYEDPQSSPNAKAETRATYRIASGKARFKSTKPLGKLVLPESLRQGPQSSKSPKLRMYTTMATWCPACLLHLPNLRQLRQSFDSETLGMYGVPVDDKEDSKKLGSFVEQHKPPYRLLTELNTAQRTLWREFLAKAFRKEALPSTIITDSEGRVVLKTTGLPSLSELTRLYQADF